MIKCNDLRHACRVGAPGAFIKPVDCASAWRQPINLKALERRAAIPTCRTLFRKGFVTPLTMTYRSIYLIVTFVALAIAPAARACEVALAFAIDVSGSISDQDYRIQMSGLAEGLRDPMVSHTLARGDSAVMVLLWSGRGEQLVAIDWRHMTTEAHVASFAADVESLPRPFGRSATALGEALGAVAAAMTQAPACDRLVVDISGDGRSNEGVLPRDQRLALEAMNVTVNAIGMSNRSEGSRWRNNRKK